MADELRISDDGNYLWDGDKWISVQHVPLRVFAHTLGAHLSADDNFWWNHVANRWERVADAPASAKPPAGPPGQPNPVTTTTTELEEPPSIEHMQWARDVVEVALASIVGPTTELAEKVLGLSNNHEAAQQVLHGGTDTIHALEMFGIEGGAVFGAASTASMIAGPFMMWYEAIGANNAGNLAHLKWLVYDPWMHGFIHGLYNQDTGNHDPLFAGWRELGMDFTSGMDGDAKRAVTGVLIAHYVYSSSSSQVVNARLTHEQWDQRTDWRNAYEGLRLFLSATG